MLTSEAGLEISLQGPFLSVAVLLPEKFLTHTRGLLGTLNDNPADDFTLRSGEVLPPSASSRELFRFGADCKRPRAGGEGARPWGGLGGGAGSPQTLPPARPAAIFPGAVQNASSLLTYDSKFLVENFKEQPKHDPTFLPLFPEESPTSPSQASAAADLCGDDSFCTFDVAATGSLSVGNASRVAHMQHLLRVRSLQPGKGDGEGWGAGEARARAPGAGTRPPRLVTAGGELRSDVCAPPPPQWCPVAGWPRLPTDTSRVRGTWWAPLSASAATTATAWLGQRPAPARLTAPGPGPPPRASQVRTPRPPEAPPTSPRPAHSA